MALGQLSDVDEARILKRLEDLADYTTSAGVASLTHRCAPGQASSGRGILLAYVCLRVTVSLVIVNAPVALSKVPELAYLPEALAYTPVPPVTVPFVLKV